MNVAIVYHSVTGTTARLAEAVADGCHSVPEVTAALLRIEAADIEQGRYHNRTVINAIDRADAVIFGSPTFMGSVSAQFKAFADATAGEYWGEQLWADKIAAGFTVGTGYCGDTLHSLHYLQILAAQQGMLWAGLDLAGAGDRKAPNRLGAQAGVIVRAVDGAIETPDLHTAFYLGQRVARLVGRFRVVTTQIERVQQL
ncbi:flavodoxin family protein [Rheinheimera tangshanensis]|jgi:NAD(P)H dehydrogenase (quinone)|uniref:Flavodoxin family protein n=1 Tax=Rheinheimera tangshanensis TaxID=400153 RepID=A0A5C8LU46_9GAMM|nr:flavodoxin family protein [Rheinheimera tangshanensis]MBP8227819.1 flavodoxin family protein [Rheinheimera sp.]TXK80866.1 flavodoxin family protein [Rheinheimera tangshanensis]GGM63431.1 flavodoxin [Rheinheimera tangshanensis]